MAFASVPNLNIIQFLQMFFMSIHVLHYIPNIIFLLKKHNLTLEPTLKTKAFLGTYLGVLPGLLLTSGGLIFNRMIAVKLSPIYNFVNEIIVQLELLY